jgi:hypothetical protein
MYLLISRGSNDSEEEKEFHIMISELLEILENGENEITEVSLYGLFVGFTKVWKCDHLRGTFINRPVQLKEFHMALSIKDQQRPLLEWLNTCTSLSNQECSSRSVKAVTLQNVVDFN